MATKTTVDQDAKAVITDVNRKPWIQRQQNILMLCSLGFCVLGALNGLINAQVESLITSVIVAGVTILTGVSAESLRDKNKFEAAATLLQEASKKTE